MYTTPPKLTYRSGTSIRTPHDFTYVLDDGRGGRAKGRVHVTVLPLDNDGNAADDPAFAGAQGFGALATGGRGRAVYSVTRLQDDRSPGHCDGLWDRPKPRVAGSSCSMSPEPLY